MNRKTAMADEALSLLLPDFALPPEHIALTQSPSVPTRALVEAAATTSRTIGRPYLIWKDDLELAREVNERLAAGSLH